MLVQNRSFPSQNNLNTKNQRYSARENIEKRKQRNKNVTKNNNSLINPEISNNQETSIPPSLPLWLKFLLITKNISSLFCYISVALALVMYGMTVYAPELWTQKYNQLRELQKKERQFTFSDEVIKHQLANDASLPNSGLINPDATKPAIFLPETKVNKIKSSLNNKPLPKEIKSIYPVAY